MFVPETDKSLVIESFQAMGNEDLTVIPIVDFNDIPQYYSTGDAVPIPVWKSGNIKVIISSWTWEKVTAEIGDAGNVSKRLQRTLHAANKGLFGESELVRKRLWEFLSVKPTADRYWVDSFRNHLMEVSTSRRDENASLLPEYAQLAQVWARACAPKAEFKEIDHFVAGLGEYGKLHPEFIEAQAIALMKQIVAKPSSSRQMSRLISEVTERNRIPGVMDVIMSLGSRDQEIEDSFWKFKKCFRDSLISGKRTKIEAYSRLFGNSKNIPADLSEVAHDLLRYKVDELKRAADLVFNGHFRESMHVQQSVAGAALEDAKLVELIYGFLNPDAKNEDVFKMHWSGIDRDTLLEFENAAKGRAY
jgi:hypothetical protein